MDLPMLPSVLPSMLLPMLRSRLNSAAPSVRSAGASVA